MPPSAVPKRIVLYQDNTQKINVYGLQDDTGAYLNDATMTATLLDPNRNEVPGCIDVSMVYVTASNGDYSGQVDATFSPSVGTEYVLVIDGDQGGAHLHVELPTDVKVRSR